MEKIKLTPSMTKALWLCSNPDTTDIAYPSSLDGYRVATTSYVALMDRGLIGPLEVKRGPLEVKRGTFRGTRRHYLTEAGVALVADLIARAHTEACALDAARGDRMPIGQRGEVDTTMGDGAHGTSRRWRRAINGRTYSFTVVNMPNGDLRMFVRHYNGYAGGMSFQCAWTLDKSIIIRAEAEIPLTNEHGRFLPVSQRGWDSTWIDFLDQSADERADEYALADLHDKAVFKCALDKLAEDIEAAYGEDVYRTLARTEQDRKVAAMRQHYAWARTAKRFESEALRMESIRRGGCGRVTPAGRFTPQELCEVQVQCGPCAEAASKQDVDWFTSLDAELAAGPRAAMREANHAEALRMNAEAELTAWNAQVAAWFLRHAGHGHEADRRHGVDNWSPLRECDETEGRIGNMVVTFSGIFDTDAAPGSRRDNAKMLRAWEARHRMTRIGPWSEWTAWFLADEVAAYRMDLRGVGLIATPVRLSPVQQAVLFLAGGARYAAIEGRYGPEVAHQASSGGSSRRSVRALMDRGLFQTALIGQKYEISEAGRRQLKAIVEADHAEASTACQCNPQVHTPQIPGCMCASLGDVSFADYES